MRAVLSMCGDNTCYQTINVGRVKGYLAAWSLRQRWDVARPRHASRARAASRQVCFSHTQKLSEAWCQRAADGPHTVWVTGKTQASRPNPTRHGQRPVLGEAQVPACTRHLRLFAPRSSQAPRKQKQRAAADLRPVAARLRPWAEELSRSRGVQAYFLLRQPGAL